MDKFVAFFEKLPTGKIRIIITVILITSTGIVYLMSACQSITPAGQCEGWEPTSNWLIFLAALAGVDLTQYAARSFAGIKHAQLSNGSIPPVDVSFEESDSTSTTDVSEIQTTVQEQKG